MSRAVFTLFAAMVAVVSAPAFAQDAAPATQSAVLIAKAGQVVRDVSGRRIGVVDSVRGDNVLVIAASKMVRVPVSTLSVGTAGLQTSLKSSELQ